MGNALLYISLLSVALIASFTGSAILNDLFAICNSQSLPTNQIMNCEAGCVLFRGAPCFLFLTNKMEQIGQYDHSSNYSKKEHGQSISGL